MDVSGHSLFLLQQLNVQREFGFLCDCTVAIGNVYFKAHRAVLAAFSNYFKMIFIHQSSECIKIQPTDIQPDVFSYLLHIMYTGVCPKQPVDGARLQDGIRFLHAYQLCRTPGEGGGDAAADRMSNLYGIQISSQLASKEGGGAPKAGGGASRGAAEDGRKSGLVGRSHAQLALAGGLGGVQGAELHATSSVASGDDPDASARIKQERVEEEGGLEGGGSMPSPARGGASPCQGFLFRESPLLCPRCGERCTSPEGLRDHLLSHSACGLEGLSQGGGEADGAGEEGGPQGPLDAGCLEEALRQSRALANQLAAELRRSRGASPPELPPAILHSRKRKMACAVCSLRFSHKTQLQEHMYTHVHTGKPSRFQRYNRLCSQLLHASRRCCEGVEGGAGAQDPPRDAQDNGSSCYSLDSEVSQESGDTAQAE